MATGNGAQVPWEPTVLTWNGRDYTISANSTMGAIARVEDHITLFELIAAGSSGKPPLAKIAQAYGSLLRYAGARVTDLEVYSAMFGRESGEDGMTVQVAIQALNSLQLLMMPPEMRAKASAGAEVADENPTPSPSAKTESSAG